MPSPSRRASSNREARNSGRGEVQFAPEPEPYSSPNVYPEPVSSPEQCRVEGLDCAYTAKREATFTVCAYDELGNRKLTGGEAFFIAIRGASRVRARVFDNNDGTYRVDWTPHVSGDYHIAVSLFGVSLHGSPFHISVLGPEPHAPNCQVLGKALYSIAARTNSSFDVKFRDRGGNIAQVRYVVHILGCDSGCSCKRAASQRCVRTLEAMRRSCAHCACFTPKGQGSVVPLIPTRSLSLLFLAPCSSSSSCRRDDYVTRFAGG